MGATLIRNFSRNHNKKLKFIVHCSFLTAFKDFSVVNFYKFKIVASFTLKQMSFWVITNRFGPAQQDKIGLETSTNLYALNYSLNISNSFHFHLQMNNITFIYFRGTLTKAKVYHSYFILVLDDYRQVWTSLAR